MLKNFLFFVFLYKLWMRVGDTLNFCRIKEVPFSILYVSFCVFFLVSGVDISLILLNKETLCAITGKEIIFNLQIFGRYLKSQGWISV